MSGQWEDKGVVPDITVEVFGGDTHRVENTETGEEKYLEVYGTQTVGEAIADGQWKKEED